MVVGADYIAATLNNMDLIISGMLSCTYGCVSMNDRIVDQQVESLSTFLCGSCRGGLSRVVAADMIVVITVGTMHMIPCPIRADGVGNPESVA